MEEMEDELEYYEMLNRDAILVKPKKPLFDWANSLTPDEDPVPESKTGKIYLIKEKDTPEAVDRWLRKHFDRIFTSELADWWLDENDWPEKRTFKLFKEWFDYEIHQLVLDMESEDIVKD